MFGHGEKAVEASSDDNPESPRTDNDHAVRDSRVIDPESGVKRGLKNRHLSMMASVFLRT